MRCHFICDLDGGTMTMNIIEDDDDKDDIDDKDETKNEIRLSG